MQRPALAGTLRALRGLLVLRRHRHPGRGLGRGRPLPAGLRRLERTRHPPPLELARGRPDALGPRGPPRARPEPRPLPAATRGRWPTERALLKVLRDDGDQALLDHEWTILADIRARTPEGAAAMLARLPEPIVRGRVSHGAYAGRSVMVLRAARGFRHTLDDVRRAFPEGVPPQSSIRVWRRALEGVALLHDRRVAHGPVPPR